MKKISVENMSTIQGGDMCTFNRVIGVAATVALYATPFTAGGGIAIALGLIAFASVMGAGYATASSCR